MYRNDTIYFPGTEARNVLVPVTSGCPHNVCTFCTMYKETAYKPVALSDIEYELKNVDPQSDKVFLVGADPLCVGYERISSIIDIIKKYLPHCARITAYCSIRTVAKYTVEQLKDLCDRGITALYIGFESGDDEVLKKARKGHTVAMAVEQAHKLNEAGILFSTVVMYGLAGKGNGVQNAIKTAEMTNKFKTYKVVTMNLTVFEGSEIADMIRNGDFVEEDGAEKRLEIRTLLEHLDVKQSTMFDTRHATNPIKMVGTLPRDKEMLLEKLK